MRALTGLGAALAITHCGDAERAAAPGPASASGVAAPSAPDEAPNGLPAVPASAANGWILVRDAPEGAFAGDTGLVDDLLFAPPSSPRPTADDLARARRELEALAPTPAEAEVLAAALARERFVLVCEPDPPQPERCPLLRAAHALGLATRLALRDVLEGRDTEAIAGALAVLRAASDLAATARSLPVAAYGLTAVVDAIGLADLVGVTLSLRDDLVAVATTLEGLRELSRALVGLGGPGCVPESAFAGTAINEGLSETYVRSLSAYGADPEGHPAPAPPDPTSTLVRSVARLAAICDRAAGRSAEARSELDAAAARIEAMLPR